MSRTYKKVIKVGICTGSNTKYYRQRRRKIMNKNKQILRNAVAHYNNDEIDDHVYEYKQPKTDSWSEPTDGTYLIGKNHKTNQAYYISDYSNKYLVGSDYIKRKILPKLKKKH